MLGCKLIEELSDERVGAFDGFIGGIPTGHQADRQDPTAHRSAGAAGTGDPAAEPGRDLRDQVGLDVLTLSKRLQHTFGTFIAG